MPVFTSIASLGATVGGALGVAGPMTFGSSLALGAGTIGVGGFAAKKALDALSPKAPSLPSPQSQQATAPSMDASEAKAKEQIDKKRRSIARNKTVYTSPLGLTPKEKSDINLKTLTGQ